METGTAATLASLPAELHAAIAESLAHAAPASDTDGGALEPLKALRLGCKALAAAYTPLLFKRAALWPRSGDVRRFQTLLRDAQLAPLIRGVTFYTFVQGEHGHIEPSAVPAEEWLRAAEEVTCAPNLRAVEVCFAYRTDWSSEDYSVVPWVTGDQGNGLTVDNVLQAVCSKIFTTDNTALDDLTLRCLAATPLPDSKTAVYLQQVFALLRSLSLDLYIGKDKTIPMRFNNHAATYSFFQHSLPAYLSAASNLTSLSLSAGEDYWGFIPHVDWDSLSLPSLRALTLRRFTFAHPSILSFLTRHAAHLTDLALHSCPIVAIAVDPRVAFAGRGTAQYFEADWAVFATGPRHIRCKTSPFLSRGSVHMWFHSWRWAGLFDSFRRELTALQRFEFAADPDAVLPPSRPVGVDAGVSLTSVETYLARSAYVAFTSGMGRYIWAGCDYQGMIVGLSNYSFDDVTYTPHGGPGDRLILRAPVDVARDGEALRKLHAACRERQPALDLV